MKLQSKKRIVHQKVKKGKKYNKKKSVELSTLSVDGFMGGEWPSDESESDTNPSKSDDADESPVTTLEVNGRKKKNALTEEEDKQEYNPSGSVSLQDDAEDTENINDKMVTSEEDENDGEDGDDDNSSLALDGRSHKKSLQKLRDLDPEFYKFLSQNDKSLLEFNLSESESDEEGEDEEGKVHKPPKELEVGSDESDYEAVSDTEKVDSRIITLKMVNAWQEQLQTDSSLATIKNVVKAFHAALMRVSTEEDKGTAVYKVDGSSVFNAVIQLCVLELQPAIKRFLKLPATGSSHIQPFKCKRWPKIKSIVKFYLRNLLKLVSGVSSTQIVAVLLKHLHQMTPFLACYTQMIRPLLKKLVHFWAGGEETVRVIAFLCLLKLTTGQQKEILDKVLKLMYMAYVSNSKFVSPNTLPAINFMRRSLTEMYALDLNTSYHPVFLYIRQLAIHLRNAITLQKKETTQAVYNWQFIHSLHLWAELLGATANKPQLQPLIYPLVQVVIGTIKLIPTAQYFPLRFHCVQILIQLSKNTSTFIPLLPFLLEVLNSFDFNKRHTKVSMKPVDFTCIVRVSKSQLQENGFKDAVIERIYQQLLEHLTDESYRISFPDSVVPTKLQLKTFIKTCKVSNYCKKIRQVLDKIEENAQIVEKERNKVSIALNDHKAIDAWETKMKLDGTPLMKFYESWSKVNARQLAKRITDNDKLAEFDLPVLKKRDKKPSETKSEGPVVLFPSDDSDEDDMFGSEEQKEPKKKRGKRGRKGNKLRESKTTFSEPDNDMGDTDIVEDLRLSDLE